MKLEAKFDITLDIEDQEPGIVFVSSKQIPGLHLLLPKEPQFKFFMAVRSAIERLCEDNMKLKVSVWTPIIFGLSDSQIAGNGTKGSCPK